MVLKHTLYFISITMNLSTLCMLTGTSLSNYYKSYKFHILMSTQKGHTSAMFVSKCSLFLLYMCMISTICLLRVVFFKSCCITVFVCDYYVLFLKKKIHLHNRFERRIVLILCMSCLCYTEQLCPSAASENTLNCLSSVFLHTPAVYCVFNEGHCLFQVPVCGHLCL